jgi:hypothetical protein
MSTSTEVGQRVLIDSSQHPIPKEWEGVPLTVVDVQGSGDDAFVRLATDAGKTPTDAAVPLGTQFFRVTELLPAPSDEGSPLPKTRTKQLDTQGGAMSGVMNLTARATELVRTQGMTYAAATKQAARELGADTDAYLRGETPPPTTTPARPTKTPAPTTSSMHLTAGQAGLRAAAQARKAANPSLSDAEAVEHELRETYSGGQFDLSVRPGETFAALAQRVATARQIPLASAVKLVSQHATALATAWSAGTGL